MKTRSKKWVAALGAALMALSSCSIVMAEETTEPEVLTIAIQQDANVEDYETNFQTQLIEEGCNVKLEFQLLPTSDEDAKTKLALMISSGEKLPDVICMELSNLEVFEYGTKGVFLPMNDYLYDAEKMPYFNSIPEQDLHSILEAITSPDGNIYTLTNWSPEDWKMTPYRCWINQTWLDTLGLEVPTTTDELLEVCRAFATQDPNGNGTNDEIPITGSTPNFVWGGFTPYFLMNSFVFYNGNEANNGLALGDDGKTVIAPFVTEQWKAGLEYMNTLCQEGLLDPSMFTMDSTQFTALLDQAPNRIGCVCAGGWGYWTNGLDSENFSDFQLLSPLQGPDGIAYAATSVFTPPYYWNVTKDCENMDLAMRVADIFYRKDVSYTSRYGEEGVDWSTDEADTSQKIGLYQELLGIPCRVAVLQEQWGKVQNKHWYTECPRYLGLEDYRGLDSMQKGDDNRDAIFRTTSYQIYVDAHPELLPTLNYTSEEAEQISSIAADVTTYVSNSLAEFVTGNRPLSDWDSYLSDLDNMGLPQLLEISQTAYDRMSAE